MYSAVELVASNDADGNIRRGWEVSDGGRIVARVRSGWLGLQALRNALERLGVTGVQDVSYNVDAHVSGSRRISAAEWDGLDAVPEGSV